MDLDLWNLSGVESLNMVGRLVQVYFQGKAGSTIGVVYTIDPEIKFLVLLTNFDLIKSELYSL
jgi:hypothetical protein